MCKLIIKEFDTFNRVYESSFNTRMLAKHKADEVVGEVLKYEEVSPKILVATTKDKLIHIIEE